MHHAEWRHLPVQYLIRNVQREHQLSETGPWRAISEFLVFVAVGTVITICSVELQIGVSKFGSQHNGGSGTPPPPDNSTADARNRLILQVLGLLAAFVNISLKYVVDSVVKLWLEHTA